MAVLPIRTLGDPVLRRKARRVSIIDGSIQRLIDDMIDTMRDVSGVGLAAPQVGVPLRVIVVGLPGEELLTLVNPELVNRSGEREIVEGCLSIPGYHANIKRSLSVTVKGRDREGKQTRIKADGLLAQALEHELDHLNGVLFIDYIKSPEELHRSEPDESAEL